MYVKKENELFKSKSLGMEPSQHAHEMLFYKATSGAAFPICLKHKTVSIQIGDF